VFCFAVLLYNITPSSVSSSFSYRVGLSLFPETNGHNLWVLLHDHIIFPYIHIVVYDDYWLFTSYGIVFPRLVAPGSSFLNPGTIMRSSLPHSLDTSTMSFDIFQFLARILKLFTQRLVLPIGIFVSLGGKCPRAY